MRVMMAERIQVDLSGFASRALPQHVVAAQDGEGGAATGAAQGSALPARTALARPGTARAGPPDPRRMARPSRSRPAPPRRPGRLMEVGSNGNPTGAAYGCNKKTGHNSAYAEAL
ncbi:hypothetical protein GCM10010336_72560 [Streptomyces goshikiensis]|nr:hypothetical protein GCM10010336_72560 [Streptomyces goshikiensis]